MSKPDIARVLASCKHMRVDGLNFKEHEVEAGFFQEIHIVTSEGSLVLRGLMQIVDDTVEAIN